MLKTRKGLNVIIGFLSQLIGFVIKITYNLVNALNVLKF